MPTGQYTLADLDPLDFSAQYNTPIPQQQQAAFNQWTRQQAARTGKNPLRDMYDYDIQGDWLAGANRDVRGHGSDRFKKPNHPTFSDQSQLHGIDGFVGGQWTPQGYVPSATNLQFRTPDQLQQYFSQTEPDTKLLPPAALPKPTGRNGQYRISDFAQVPGAGAPGVQFDAPRVSDHDPDIAALVQSLLAPNGRPQNRR